MQLLIYLGHFELKWLRLYQLNHNLNASLLQSINSYIGTYVHMYKSKEVGISHYYKSQETRNNIYDQLASNLLKLNPHVRSYFWQKFLIIVKRVNRASKQGRECFNQNNLEIFWEMNIKHALQKLVFKKVLNEWLGDCQSWAIYQLFGHTVILL